MNHTALAFYAFQSCMPEKGSAFYPPAKAARCEVNFAKIPDTLIESERSSPEKGAFTGALRLCCGRFEEANGGALFADEVGKLFAGRQEMDGTAGRNPYPKRHYRDRQKYATSDHQVYAVCNVVRPEGVLNIVPTLNVALNGVFTTEPAPPLCGKS